MTTAPAPPSRRLRAASAPLLSPLPPPPSPGPTAVQVGADSAEPPCWPALPCRLASPSRRRPGDAAADTVPAGPAVPAGRRSAGKAALPCRLAPPCRLRSFRTPSRAGRAGLIRLCRRTIVLNPSRLPTLQVRERIEYIAPVDRRRDRDSLNADGPGPAA